MSEPPDPDRFTNASPRLNSDEDAEPGANPTSNTDAQATSTPLLPPTANSGAGTGTSTADLPPFCPGNSNHARHSVRLDPAVDRRPDGKYKGKCKSCREEDAARSKKRREAAAGEDRSAAGPPPFCKAHTSRRLDPLHDLTPDGSSYYTRCKECRDGLSQKRRKVTQPKNVRVHEPARKPS
jgi:hypothetical protein